MKTITLSTICAVIAQIGVAATINVAVKGEKLDHYWSFGVGAGRVNEGLRCGWQEHLARSHEECGFRYVRMHDTFNDDMFVCVGGTGNGERGMVYNWQYIDDVYDRMLAKGVRPFVEFSFFPKQIAATNTMTQMWYRNRVTVDPAKFGAWHDLCKAFVQHCVDRYGLEEVQKWYFEVWNEPNLYKAFFDGAKSDYFRLYKESANAVKEVHPSLKVGGPATSNFIADHRHDGETQDNTKSVFYPQETINQQQWKGVWIEEFLAFCKKEKLPVDFVSCHAYPTDYALDPVSGRGKDAIRYVHSLRDDLTWLKRTVAASAYPNAEIHITEWSTSPNSRDAMHDNLPPAAYIVKAMCECTGLADSVMYWTFTDIFEEKGGGDSIFHGGFGMLSFQGVAKPSYHAYRMLNALGDEVIYNQDPVIVTRRGTGNGERGKGKVVALAYAYPKEYESHVPARQNLKDCMSTSSTELDLALTGLSPNAAFEMETLDDSHGNAIRAWEAMGKPRSPSIAETAALKAAGDATKKEIVRADKNGTLALKRTLAPWSLLLITEL
jgi:xylan 1,4-beta-xylosidase